MISQLSIRNRLACAFSLVAILSPVQHGARLGAQLIHVSEDHAVLIGLEEPLVEPHLVIHPANPAHLLGAALISVATESVEERIARQRCVSFVSTDNGTSWQRHDFPITSCFDPWVAITPDGQAVFTALASHPNLPQQGSGGLIVYHSADGGRTWDDQPIGLGRGHDHQTVVVDRSSSERESWLYVISSRDIRADQGKRRFGVFVARSRNGGKAFDVPVHIRPNNLLILAEIPVVLSDGTLVVSFVEAAGGDGRTLLLRRRAWVVRSTDGGHTFSSPMFVNEACGGPSGFSLSALVTDTSPGLFRDRLYFACNLPESDGVVVHYSSNGGESWSNPIPVHSLAADTLVSRKLMAAAVNNKGVVGVAWTDGRKRPGTNCYGYDIYFAASLDGGDTFLPEERVSSATSCPDETVSGRWWSDGGDYFGMATDDGGRFRLLWSDARQGLFQLRTAVVEVDAKGTRRN